LGFVAFHSLNAVAGDKPSYSDPVLDSDVPDVRNQRRLLTGSGKPKRMRFISRLPSSSVVTITERDRNIPVPLPGMKACAGAHCTELELV
jgi:hypothetical protein